MYYIILNFPRLFSTTVIQFIFFYYTDKIYYIIFITVCDSSVQSI